MAANPSWGWYREASLRTTTATSGTAGPGHLRGHRYPTIRECQNHGLLITKGCQTFDRDASPLALIPQGHDAVFSPHPIVMSQAGRKRLGRFPAIP
jgi:hypothetical protein